MSAIKRDASSRATRLTARPSPYHKSVVLYEDPDIESSVDVTFTPRRSKRIKTEHSTVVDLEDTMLPSAGTAKSEATAMRSITASPAKQASSSPRKVKPIQQSLATPHPAPARWRETYDKIKEMRAGIIAPVDTMGCAQTQFGETDPKSQRFTTLVSLMLSSQTKDEVTHAAVGKLREAVGGKLTVDAIIDADETTISEAIGKVGFWRRKTGYIKQTAQRLRDDFNSDVPKTVDELCSLPGVGPKMAFLALQVAWNLNHGIGVDVHVHRITNRLGWHQKPTKNPEETRLNLQSWLPKELHADINHMLVGFGQVICLPIGPRCDQCVLSVEGLCPSAQKVVNSKNRKTIKIEASGSKDAQPKIEVKLEEDQDHKAMTIETAGSKISPPKIEVKLENDNKPNTYIPPVDAQANC